MACYVCSETLQSMWDPANPRRLCDIGEMFPNTKTYQRKKGPPGHPDNYFFGHHTTSESLLEAISNGCPICTLLKAPSDYSEEFKFQHLGYFSVFTIRFGGVLPRLQGHTDQQGWFAHTLLPVDCPKLTLNGSTGDASAMKLIQGWLETCVETHKSCQVVEKQTFIPPLLVQLDKGSASFRVAPAAEITPGTRYTTFTHCYNPDDDGIKLLESTAKSFSSRQPLSILPQSYRDACEVTSQLGLSHIWIDRLCVVQDSQSDQMAHQHQIMRRDIFSNSLCGIGAAGSTSSSSGLFTQSDRSHLPPDVFYFQATSDAPSAPYIFFTELETGKMQGFRYELLSNNARALRDRLLVPRMVYFGSQMLFWECHTSHYNEFGLIPSGHSLQITGRSSEVTYDGKSVIKLWKPLFEYSAHQQDDPINQIVNRWFALVSRYTTLDVSPQEKLPLLENLASEVKQLLIQHGCEDTTYLAGMWKMSLPSALLWDSRTNTKYQKAPYHAPTWSWAAAAGEVYYVYPLDKWRKGLVCELIDSECTTGDHTGAIKSASITIKGKLLLGKLTSHSFEPPLAGDLRILTLTDPNNSPSFSSIASKPLGDPNYQDWNAKFDYEQDRSDDVLCLPIQSRTDSTEGPGLHYLYGILLRQLDDGRYVRLGDWRIQRRSMDDGVRTLDGLQDVVLEII